MPDCQPLSVLEYASKELLRRVYLSKVQCLSLVKQLLEGVAFLHEHNIAHLDIKPDNLVIDRGTLYIIDYGLAEHKRTTLTGYRGTEEYVAPEVSDDGTYNPIQADLWSTGRVIQELLKVHISPETYTKLDFLDNIACKLTTVKPSERPPASEMLKEIFECAKHLNVEMTEQVEMPK
ncbi:kinase-like domain-containing protein [Endogone sp. FLAS-F59071]|nr:kinase-like domain-containing protein [Endogone sp. FLAS-F59071]|eukprot:RUS13555.1 kinase-like domain-containing protein [Endogone sp. FLAS-F59071]